MGFPQSADGLVRTALTQAGDKYVYGAEASASNPNPSAFDCSELVEWSLAQIGIRFVDGAENQYRTCKRAGKEISVAQAVNTRGALLFRIGAARNGNSDDHVGISQGNGQTIEARGRAFGVGQWSATSGRTWTHGGLVPGLPGYGLGAGASAAVQVDPGPAPLTPEQLADIQRKRDLDTVAAIIRSMRKVVRYGDTGEAVTILQQGLQKQGYWVPVTGVLDSYTRSVVQQLQAKRRKRADGIVGPVTWNQIFPDFSRFAY
jgi:cell wall-associated NlpC family hydrolase